jgi:hypothetical protein
MPAQFCVDVAHIRTCVAMEISHILELSDSYAEESRTNALEKIGKEQLATVSKQFAGIASRLSLIIGLDLREGGAK